MKKTVCYKKTIIIVAILLLVGCPRSKIMAKDLQIGQASYAIEKPKDLHGIRTTPSAIYLLKNDIDMSQEDMWEPIKDFSGVLDGAGYKITGLKIKSDGKYPGLFEVNKGVIKNLKIENPIISSANAGKAVTYIGVVAGKNQKVIENIVMSHIDVQETDFVKSIVGGIVGDNEGEIKDCQVSGRVRGRTVGGLAGRNLIGGIITQSSFSGNIESSYYMGGLVGNNSGTIENSFSQSRLKVASKNINNIGGIAGDNTGQVCCCYANVKVDGSANRVSGAAVVRGDDLDAKLFYNKDDFGAKVNVISGEAKSEAELKDRKTYAGWNFKSIWHMIDGTSYPYLLRPGEELPQAEEPQESEEQPTKPDETEAEEPQESEEQPMEPDETEAEEPQESEEQPMEPDATEADKPQEPEEQPMEPVGPGGNLDESGQANPNESETDQSQDQVTELTKPAETQNTYKPAKSRKSKTTKKSPEKVLTPNPKESQLAISEKQGIRKYDRSNIVFKLLGKLSIYRNYLVSVGDILTLIRI